MSGLAIYGGALRVPTKVGRGVGLGRPWRSILPSNIGQGVGGRIQPSIREGWKKSAVGKKPNRKRWFYDDDSDEIDMDAQKWKIIQFAIRLQKAGIGFASTGMVLVLISIVWHLQPIREVICIRIFSTVGTKQGRR